MNFALLFAYGTWHVKNTLKVFEAVLSSYYLLHKIEIVGRRLIFWSVAYDFLIACMDEKQTSSEGLKLKFG